MRSNLIGMCSAVAAVAVAGSANAAVIYDSTWMYQAGTVSPTATSGWNNNIVSHASAAFWANQKSEAGGKVAFAGTDRYVQSATVQMRTGSSASGAVAGTISATLNFYSINSDGSIGNLLVTKTQSFATPASSGPSSVGYQWRPFFDITFNLDGLGSLPDQVYWGLAYDGNQNPVANSLNLGLWNYGTAPGFGPTDSDFDASVIKTGADLSGETWARSSSTGATGFWYSGFTPTMQLSAVPTPGAIALLGAAGLVGGRRRKA